MRFDVPEVSLAWERVPPAEGGSADADAWAGHGLQVPTSCDNHYFVRGMGEFEPPFPFDVRQWRGADD